MNRYILILCFSLFHYYAFAEIFPQEPNLSNLLLYYGIALSGLIQFQLLEIVKNNETKEGE